MFVGFSALQMGPRLPSPKETVVPTAAPPDPASLAPAADRSTDPLELYRWAVQDPETHAVLLRTIYQRLRAGRRPVTLREDFAGTCADAVAWVALRPERRALAIDLDGATLDWARRRAQRVLGPAASRIGFRCADVCAPEPAERFSADIVSALNFSAQYLHDDSALGDYLRHARVSLAPDGIVVFNAFGGGSSMEPSVRRWPVQPKPRLASEQAVAPFDYIWEVRASDPARGRVDCRIHFDVPDPTAPQGRRRLEDAFRYDFRVRSAGDLVRACREAGFSDAQIWLHTYDASRGAAGVFLGAVDPATVDRSLLWTAYIVACA